MALNFLAMILAERISRVLGRAVDDLECECSLQRRVEDLRRSSFSR
jgi:hypothetical protein